MCTHGVRRENGCCQARRHDNVCYEPRQRSGDDLRAITKLSHCVVEERKRNTKEVRHGTDPWLRVIRVERLRQVVQRLCAVLHTQKEYTAPQSRAVSIGELDSDPDCVPAPRLAATQTLGVAFQRARADGHTGGRCIPRHGGFERKEC